MRAYFLILLITMVLTAGLTGADSPPRWEIQKSNSTASLRGVCTVDSNTAWASGSNGTFLRTTDGGKTWKAGTVAGHSKLDFRDIQAFDSDTALVISAGNPAKIYKTTDGGKSWKETFSNEKKGVFFDSMAFWNRKKGIAFSDPVNRHFLLIVTDDGGENWRRIPARYIPLPLKGEAGFAASGTCVAVQGTSNAWFCTGGGAARVIGTTDGGKTWKAFRTPILSGQPSEGIFGVAFYDASNGVIVGGDYKKEAVGIKNAAYTADGGKTWTLVKEGRPAGFRECAAYVPGGGGKMLVTVGPSGSDYSTDGGKTWKNFSDEGFHSLSFAPKSTTGGAATGGLSVGWAVGADGRVAKIIIKL